MVRACVHVATNHYSIYLGVYLFRSWPEPGPLFKFISTIIGPIHDLYRGHWHRTLRGFSGRKVLRRRGAIQKTRDGVVACL